ncbi:hypothetical protein N7510_005208 [Penicillium lagena]|uniref:uncharacterized protein n=1 Tax=Penicillium lagena TaxID=94218 RepID=UPI00253F8739|nr:uncharacterized protein N7510_005208 [Penicillium lagena]KAJ5612014.1 hypothetical protein N7510_005208 [Penicillium lagena]
MATISLDDIIQYQPPATKLPRNSNPPQVPSFISKYSDPSPFDGTFPSHGPPHGFPSCSPHASDFSPSQFSCPQNPRSTVIDSQAFFANTGPRTDAVSAWLGELDRGWFNTHEDQNDRVTMSSFHGKSGDGRVQVLSGEQERDKDNYDFHKNQNPGGGENFTTQGQTGSEFHDPSSQPLVLGPSHGPGLPAPAEMSFERTKQFSLADQVKTTDSLVRQTDAVLDLVDETTTAYDQRSAIANQRSHTSQSVPQPCDIQPDSPNITEVLNARAPPSWISEETTEAEDNNILPITSVYSVVDSATNEAANDDYECGVHRSVERSLAFSEHGPSTRKTQSDPVCDESSDDQDDSDDGDYIDDHCPKSRGHGASSLPTRQLSQTTTRHTPTRIQNRTTPHSTVDATQFDHSEDQTHTTSLQNTETIPVRGFLTRQIFLSRVVYSFTFEEERSNTCSHKWDEASALSENKLGTRYSKHKKPKKPQVSNATAGTRYLSEDDRILIELKEKQNLPWSRIVEHFPGRSKGSLQFGTDVKYAEAACHQKQLF